jgi:pSer/pThr/pTyr-binding forkhead associated (FHA) protein
VTEADIHAAVRELQWVEFALRPNADRGALPTLVAAMRRDERTPEGFPDAAHKAARDATAGAPLARLLVVSRGKTVGERALPVGRLIIGRATDADLRVESPVISRHHCQVITSERLCVLEDLNSSNGVYIKNQRVRRHNLNDGDVVTLGAHQLLYVDERPGTRLTPDELSTTSSHPRPAPADGVVQT